MDTTMKNPTALALFLPGFFLMSGATFAEGSPAEPGLSVNYNIGVVSDYRVRGIAQTGYRPAIQGGIDVSHSSGFYAGSFASNVNWIKDWNGATKGSAEVDVYAGYRNSITKDLGFDAGVITYRYPGNNSGAAGTPGEGLFANADTTEVYLNLSYSVANLKYYRTTGNFLGVRNSSGSQYFDLNAAFDLSDGLTLSPHVGHQSIPNQGPDGNLGNYTDYSLALAKDFGNGVVATLTAMATTTRKGAGSYYRDFNGRDLGKSAVTLGVKFNF
jgi:uncharacterized protein (TIGR02001 family)